MTGKRKEYLTILHTARSSAQHFTLRLNLFFSACTPQNIRQVTCAAAAGSNNPAFSTSLPHNAACFILFKMSFPLEVSLQDLLRF